MWWPFLVTQQNRRIDSSSPVKCLSAILARNCFEVLRRW